MLSERSHLTDGDKTCLIVNTTGSDAIDNAIDEKIGSKSKAGAL